MLGRDRPYDLVPYNNPSFIELCEEIYDEQHPEPDTRMDYCVGSLFVDMEEKLLGKTEAVHAYKAGATRDNPPRIHPTTTFP